MSVSWCSRFLASTPCSCRQVWASSSAPRSRSPGASLRSCCSPFPVHTAAPPPAAVVTGGAVCRTCAGVAA
eukprot:1603400-Alexandrium_andersonii.AAC.1